MKDLASLQKAPLREIINHLKIKVALTARKDALVQTVATHLSLEPGDDREGSSLNSSIELGKQGSRNSRFL